MKRSLSLIPPATFALALASCGSSELSPSELVGTTKASITQNPAWTDYQGLGGWVAPPYSLSAAVNAAGQVGVAQVGSANGVFLKFETDADDAWTTNWPFSWIALGGYATSSPAMIRDGSGRLIVFVRGGEGHLWFKREVTAGITSDLANMPWTSLGGTLSSTANIVPVLDANGLVEVFVLDPNGSPFEATQTGALSSFGSFQPLGGTITGTMGVTFSNGQVHAFGRGTDGAVWYTHGNSGSYTTWQSLGGQVSSSFQSVSAAAWTVNGFGMPEVYVIGTGGGLCWNPGPVANRWRCDTSGFVAASAPTAVSWNGTTSVFVTGTDQGTWELDSNDTPWLDKTGWKPLYGHAMGTPAVAVPMRNTVAGPQPFPHLFVEGTNSQIYTKEWQPAPPPSSVSAPVNYLFQISGVDVLSEVETTGDTPDTGYVDWAQLGVRINNRNPDVTGCSLGHASSPMTLRNCVAGGANTGPFNAGAPLSVFESVTSFSDTASVALVLANIESTNPGALGSNVATTLQTAGNAIATVGAIASLFSGPVGGVIGAVGAVMSLSGEAAAGAGGGQFTGTCAGGLVAATPPVNGVGQPSKDTLFLNFSGLELWDLTASGPADVAIPVSIVPPPGWDCPSSHVIHLRITRDGSALGPAAQGKSGDLAVARISTESDAFEGFTGGPRRHESNGTDGFSDWLSFTTPHTGLTSKTAFASVSRTPYNLDVFWVDGTGSVQTAAWTEMNPTFTMRTIFQGPSIIPPSAQLSAASRNPSTLDVFYIATDGNVWSGHSADGASWSNTRITTTGNGVAGGGLAALARTPDTLDVFYVATDGAVYDVSFASGGWGVPVAVTGTGVAPAGGALAATASTASDLEVFYAGNDMNVYEWTWTLSHRTWIRNIAANGGFARPGGPISAVSRQPGMFDVALSGVGRLYELSCQYGCQSTPFTTTAIPVSASVTPWQESVSIVARTSWDLDIFFKDAGGQLYLASLPDGATSWQLSGNPFP